MKPIQLISLSILLKNQCFSFNCLGGDGTNRLVARYSRKFPFFLIAGTNNVFADDIEPTIFGMPLGIL
jgi:predicted polyphosphate/ATP-dependent NAD kinase